MVLSFDAVDPGQSVFMKTQTSIKNIQFTSTIAKKKFTDVSIYYDKDSTKHYRGTPYWNTQRAAPLDQKDKNTYSFFEHFVSINQFGRFLRIGENLYFKEISLNKVNIRLKDILKFNAHESFRVGIGAYTTHQLSSTFSAGFSYGYGTKDQTHKYQLWGNTLLHHPTQTQIQFRYQKDLLESGRPKFHGDRPMYGTEWLRRLKVARMDQYQGPSFSFSSHPVKYLDVKTQISKYEVRPQYHYIYNGAFSSFELNQFALSARYSFGQMYFRMEDKKIPFESKYPVLSFTYQQGFSLNQQGTEYKSINLKGNTN